MNHQPYEEWLFYDPGNSKEQLSKEEVVELQEHIEGCPSCRELMRAWNEVKVELELTQLISPEKGFADRWAKRLKIIKHQEHRKQALRVFLLFLLGTGVLMGLLIVLLWPFVSSPNDVFWSAYGKFINIYSLLYVVLTSLTTIFNASLKLVPVSLWIILMGIIFELGVIWIVSYRVLTLPRRITP